MERVDHAAAAARLDEMWSRVSSAAMGDGDVKYVADAGLREAIRASVNHGQVAYRYCLPVQLLGKLTNPLVDALALQKGRDSEVPGAWDARSLASKIIAPFVSRNENVLGTSGDPYVGNAMRVPRMLRDDRQKKDGVGWNRLIDVLEAVEAESSQSYTEQVFMQVLLEVFDRLRAHRFDYPLPSRIGITAVLGIAERFLAERSGGDRLLALSGALFDVIGECFGLYSKVERARINASDQASGQAADLECVDAQGHVVLAIEVKDRVLKLSDFEGTLVKARQRAIREVIFAVPALAPKDKAAIETRIEGAIATGENLYVIDFFTLARSVFVIGGEPFRKRFLQRVGEHLDRWMTQPVHRTAWKRLLEAL